MLNTVPSGMSVCERVAARAEIHHEQMRTLTCEIQRRVDTRLAQGFSDREALRYAAPLIRAAQRSRTLRDLEWLHTTRDA